MENIVIKRIWWGILASILAVTFTGRFLLIPLRESIGAQSLMPLLTVALGLLAIAALIHRGYAALLHLLWLLPVFYFLPALLPIAEERLHLILFGLFGYLSVRRYGYAAGILLGIGFAFIDEGIQALLPYRVGDWRDVLTNVVSALAGALLTLPQRETR